MGASLIMIVGFVLPPFFGVWFLKRWLGASIWRTAAMCAGIVPVLLLLVSVISVILQMDAVRQACRESGCGMALANILGFPLVCMVFFIISFLLCWSVMAFKQRGRARESQKAFE